MFDGFHTIIGFPRASVKHFWQMNFVAVMPLSSRPSNLVWW